MEYKITKEIELLIKDIMPNLNILNVRKINKKKNYVHSKDVFEINDKIIVVRSNKNSTVSDFKRAIENIKFLEKFPELKTAKLLYFDLSKKTDYFYYAYKKIPGKDLSYIKIDSGINNRQKNKITREISNLLNSFHSIEIKNTKLPNITNFYKKTIINNKSILNEIIKEINGNSKFLRDCIILFNKISNMDSSLVHGDLNKSNIIVDNKLCINGVIDVEFCGIGNKIMDLTHLYEELDKELFNMILKNCNIDFNKNTKQNIIALIIINILVGTIEAYNPNNKKNNLHHIKHLNDNLKFYNDKFYN